MVANQYVAPTGTGGADRPCSFHHLADPDRSVGGRYSSWRLSATDSPIASVLNWHCETETVANETWHGNTP